MYFSRLIQKYKKVIAVHIPKFKKFIYSIRCKFKSFNKGFEKIQFIYLKFKAWLDTKS